METKHTALMMIRIVLGESYVENILFDILICYLDAVARLSIFGCWMFVTNDGKYSPLTVLAGYYSVFAVLLLFNFIFNSERIKLEGHYWIGSRYIYYIY